MGRIILKGMQFKSHIGVYDFEQQYGNNFRVDIEVESDIVNGATDQLEATVDYSSIYSITQGVMEQPCKLIEFAAKNIMDRLVAAQLTGTYTKVIVTKLHPPLGSAVEEVSIALEWTKKVL